MRSRRAERSARAAPTISDIQTGVEQKAAKELGKAGGKANKTLQQMDKVDKKLWGEGAAR